jgi:hypothetical protein
MVSAIHTSTPSFTPRFFVKALLIVAIVIAILFALPVDSQKTFTITRRDKPTFEGNCYNGFYQIEPEPWALATVPVSTAVTKTWTFPTLNPTPRLPEARNCVNRTELERFNQATQGLLSNYTRKLLDHTLAVSHTQFEALLSHATKRFTDHLATLPPQERDYIAVIGKETKSNRWVTELALKYLPQLPTDVTLFDDAAVSLTKHPHVKQLVFFDDAAYSCTQMGYTIGMLNWALDRPLTYHTVVPLMSSTDCFYKAIESQALISVKPKKEQVIVHTALEFDILDIRPLFKDDPSLLLSRVNIYKLEEPTYSLIFDHKLADSRSIPRLAYFIDVWESFAFVSDPQPPYKPWEEMPTHFQNSFINGDNDAFMDWILGAWNLTT